MQFDYENKENDLLRLLPILESIATPFRIGGNSISKGAKAHSLQQPRANKLGEGRTLSQSEEALVQQQMRAHFPDELGIDSALWTRQVVRHLITQVCGVEMPIRTVGEYLKCWGFTPQKPLRRTYEQNPLAVEAWLKQEYPAIEQRAKRENAEIAWGDESGLRCDAQVGRGYAPVGQTPELHHNSQRASINYVASISKSGMVRFMLYTQKLTAQVFITFRKRLIAKRTRKLMSIVDRQESASLPTREAVACAASQRH